MSLVATNLYLCDGCGCFLELPFFQAVALNAFNQELAERGELPIVLKCLSCIEVRR